MMTELEEQLARADAGSLRAALSRRLGELAEDARVRLAEGVPREDYERWHQTEEAIQAASEVIAHWSLPPQPDISDDTMRAQGAASHFSRRS
ncbi:EscE/YscE/SsaE family type III secretion system needle protein co-chaperone [Propionivibrio dicarboxylicus]|uniref:Type III secretion system protein, YseE family n=1 Tax=Propionivibrio dicarboxylicus TaxID=83767 RepID=A0A1G7WSQ7_9RHOO|nr:EscE/YscE/SsaE family type III secretion system needle protein co-chaperone [Propionivibrio dicarboxylicus]SDG74973.1 type III secretion system protein, YseE family [Propionivibrio dicarboxylicus]